VNDYAHDAVQIHPLQLGYSFFRSVKQAEDCGCVFHFVAVYLVVTVPDVAHH
jgi:hypothetical protein